jgi:thiamine-monophosphate kinase
MHPGVGRWAQRSAADPLPLALSGGEDYELLFAVSPRQRRAFEAAAKQGGKPAVTRIGRLSREPGAWLEREGRLEPLGEGFSH